MRGSVEKPEQAQTNLSLLRIRDQGVRAHVVQSDCSVWMGWGQDSTRSRRISRSFEKRVPHQPTFLAVCTQDCKRDLSCAA